MLNDLTGKTFSHLHVLRRGKHNAMHLWWIVRCDCGVVKEVRGDGLRSGAVISCGHVRRERASAATSKPMPCGSRWGRLRIVKRVRSIPKRGYIYRCRCTCGRTVEVQGRHLRSGETQSCGCRYKETRSTSSFKHGYARVKMKSPEFCAYQREKSWCRNPRDNAYRYYGGKGIAFRYKTFIEFLSDVGHKPGPDFWLMRSSPDDDFAPGKLSWVPRCNRRRRRVRK
jgi:hypothetical protein